jgi:hypothetical protein
VRDEPTGLNIYSTPYVVWHQGRPICRGGDSSRIRELLRQVRSRIDEPSVSHVKGSSRLSLHLGKMSPERFVMMDESYVVLPTATGDKRALTKQDSGGRCMNLDRFDRASPRPTRTNQVQNNTSRKSLRATHQLCNCFGSFSRVYN